jgi:general secretion pathway protein M
MTLSRAAALVVLLALVGGLWIGPLSAYGDLVGGGARRLAAADDTLRRDRALLGAPAQAASAIAAAAVLFPENSDAQAAALLQEMLKRAAAAAQVEIEGIQVLQPEMLGGAGRMTVRLKARADIAALDRLLYAIETSRPLLYPDNLQIQSRAVPKAAAPAALEFQLDVSGFTPGPPA